MNWATRAQEVIKQLDGTDALKAAPPRAITIYRRYWPDAVQNDRIAAGNVEGTVSEILAGLADFRPSYVELFNEVAQTLGGGLEQHADFVADATKLLHARGLKVAGFSFSTGNPGQSEWSYLRQRSFCGVDALALHEYWGPLGLTLWEGLRHRLAHQWLDGAHPPMLITECGRDAVDGGGRGWQISGLTPAQYAAELATYAAALAEDSYVLGATVFTAGPTPDWTNYSTDDVDTSSFTGGSQMVASTSSAAAQGTASAQLAAQFSFTAEALFHITRILKSLPPHIVDAAELQTVMNNVAALNEERYSGKF